jgi:hypothetical protein
MSSVPYEVYVVSGTYGKVEKILNHKFYFFKVEAQLMCDALNFEFQTDGFKVYPIYILWDLTEFGWNVKEV